MFRSVWFYMLLIISLIVVALLLPLWHLLGLLRMGAAQRKLSHYTSYYWAKFLLAAAGVRVKVSGIENVPPEGPVLFICNHQSNFDILVLLGCLNKPKAFLAKIELSGFPVINSWMKKMGCVFIDRADMRQSVKAIKECVEVVKGGQSMVIFPEGTRSRGPKVGDFKKGILRVSEKVSVPIVPVFLNGTYKIMEANNNRIKAADVQLKVMKPVFYENMTEQEKAGLNHNLKNIIEVNLT